MKNWWLYLQSQPYREEEGDKGGGGGGTGDDDDKGGGTDDEAGKGGGDDDDKGGKGGTDDWRERVANLYDADDGSREALNTRLERYTTEKDFVVGAMQAHEKIRAGELSTGLPEDATDDQLKAYREANNIPVDGKYTLALEDGLAMTEKDMQIWGPAFEIAYQGNVNEVTMSAMTSALLLGRNQVLEEQKTQDAVDAQAFGVAAKELWGGDFDGNMNRVTNRFNLLPEEIREDITSGRDATGKPLGSNLAFLNWIVGMDREISPLSSMPGDGENQGVTAQRIVDEGHQRMSDDRIAWGRDQPAQDRYMEAVTWLEKHKQSA